MTAPDPVRRWAAAHAATLTTAAGTAQAPAGAPVPEPPQDPVPAVLAAFTEVRTWDGRANHINRVAWARHPDGRLLLATAGTDNIARIWDAGTGQELHTLTGHQKVIGEAEWGSTADGRLLLATGSFDGTARIWDPDTGQCLHTLTGHRGSGYDTGGIHIAWGTDPGGVPVLATGDPEGTIRMWDPGTGLELPAFSSKQPGHAPGAARIGSMAWATRPDGQTRLAASGSRGILHIWDPHTGQAVYTSPARRATVTFMIAYGRRADGQLVLASADRYRGAHVWAEEDGEFVSQVLTAAAGATYAVRWAPLADGRLLLATATDRALHLWDGHTLQRLHTEELGFRDTGAGRLDWTLTPDGHLLLAAASHGGQVHVWEAVLDPPARPPAGEARQLTAPGRTAPRRLGPARLVLPPEEVTPQFPEAAQIQADTTSVACVTTPDGRILLATVSASVRNVHLWDLESGRHLRTLPTSGSVGEAAWTQAADGRLLLATGDQDNTARIWDPDTGQELRALTGHSRSIRAVGWGTRADGTLLLATSSYDNTARIWDPDTGQELRAFTGQGDWIRAVAWHTRPDGTLLLATGSDDNTARIWDPDTGQELRTLTSHSRWISSVAWATRPNGTPLLATGSDDNTARIWDPDTGQELRTFPTPPANRDPIHAVAWGQAADGRLLLATAGRTGEARIWDPDTGAELAALPGTGSGWHSAAWARDREGNLLLLLVNPEAASGPVRAWLVATGASRQPELREPGPSDVRQAAQASKQLLRLGAGGLWPPLGLLADLVTLTGPGDAPAELHDARLAVLADEPGISRLRNLASGQPHWNPGARTAFAALLTAGLDIPARYTPPNDADPAQLATALASRPADAPEVPAGSWRTPVTVMRAAAAGITAQVITLLEILGPQACAGDPLLPLRLARHAPQLPALSPRQLRLLAAASTYQPASAQSALDTLTYSPGTVGVARSGPLTRLLPTQLALPPDLRATRLADNQLLYRQHRAPALPAPEPVTIILDTTPPTYGPAGTLLRLAAHLLTTTLWAHGHHPALITLDNPHTPTQLHAPADLLKIWTPATLDPPAPLLPAARRTATALGRPAVLLTHHDTARDARYVPGPATRLLTTCQPPEKPPPEPATPWHAHLPPAPTQAQLTTAISRLLTPHAGNDQ